MWHRKRLHAIGVGAPPFAHAGSAAVLHHRSAHGAAKDNRVARLPVELRHQQIDAGRMRGPRGQDGGHVRLCEQRLVRQRHQHRVQIGRQGGQARAQGAALPLVGRRIERPLQGPGIRQGVLDGAQDGLDGGRMVAQHDHHGSHAVVQQRAQHALDQRHPIAPQQAFGPIAHAPPRAGRHDDCADKAHVCGTKQTCPASLGAMSCKSFTCATSMSRGSGTPFFTASTSAITLTAISGGVLLPM